MTIQPAKPKRAKPACKTCGGTGRIVCLNSMFVAEKTRKERCGICGGTGASSYRDDPSYVRFQERARASFPRHPDFAQAA
jgi:hypothetical protein